MFRSLTLRQWKASRLCEQRSRVGTQIHNRSPSCSLDRTVFSVTLFEWGYNSPSLLLSAVSSRESFHSVKTKQET
jgi:hypothetical protein